ncbi:MAG: hypothetical protein P1U40_11270 [Coxiellaceae bacterium]|nr:hypothetical protein [Coxiellaceae bacterium]
MKLGDALCRWLLGNQVHLDFESATMPLIIGMMKDQINSAALMCNYTVVATHLATLRMRFDAIKTKEPDAYRLNTKKVDALITFFSFDLSRELDDITDAELTRWARLGIVQAQDIIDDRADKANTVSTASEVSVVVDKAKILSTMVESHDLDELRSVLEAVRDPGSRLTSRFFQTVAHATPKLTELKYAFMDLGFDVSKGSNRTGVSILDEPGSKTIFDEKSLLDRVNKYVRTNPETSMDWALIGRQFEFSHVYDLYNYAYRPADRVKIAEQISKGELTNVTVGWYLEKPRRSYHVFILSLFKLNGVTYLAHCNRGGGRSEDGSIRLFKVNNLAALSTDDLYLKVNAVETTSREYLLDVNADGEGIGKDLGLEALAIIPKELQWKQQKIGKCASEVGKMKLRMACFHQELVAKVLDPCNRELLRKDEGVPFILFIDSLKNSTRAYKHFRAFDRSASMQSVIDCLLMPKKADDIPLSLEQRVELFGRFLDFIDMEHGCDDTSAVKRAAIFKPLDDYLQSTAGIERLNSTPYYDKFCTLAKVACAGMGDSAVTTTAGLKK